MATGQCLRWWGGSHLPNVSPSPVSVCTGTSVSPKHQGIHLSPSHCTISQFCALLGRRSPFIHPLTLVFDPSAHIQVGNFTSQGTLAPPAHCLHARQSLSSSWPCMEPLPSFEPEVAAAVVVPDARPTGLECFPALPGILSPLGFSMIPLLDLRLLWPGSQEVSQCHCSGLLMVHLFFHGHTPGREEHKEIRSRMSGRAWIRLPKSSAQLCPYSPRGVRTFHFFSYKTRMVISLISHLHVTFFFHQYQSPGPKVKIPRAIQQEFKYSFGFEQLKWFWLVLNSKASVQHLPSLCCAVRTLTKGTTLHAQPWVPPAFRAASPNWQGRKDEASAWDAAFSSFP